MGYSFRPAKRSEAKPLVGLYAESGCGKTLSALYLARGFVGPSGRIGMIETESGRGEAFADILPGGYDVLPLRDTFSPQAYGQAITAAEAANLDALIIDSASHEWEGKGGVLSMAADNQAAGKKGVIVWQQPKMEHQRHFMLRLMQTPIPLVILCMRAKYPMQEEVVNGRKEWVRSKILEPIQADNILSEMFVHAWIDREHRLHVTKYTRDDWRQIFVEGQPISIETGQRLAAWAKGGTDAGYRENPSLQDAKAAGEPISSGPGALLDDARAKSEEGLDAYAAFYNALTRDQKLAIAEEHPRLKAAASLADARQPA